MSDVLDSHNPERPDYAATVDKIKQAILDRLINAHKTFSEPIRALSGNELRVALRLHNDLTTVLERVIELQAIADVIDRMLERDPKDADAKQLQDEKTLLSSMLFLSEASFMPFLKLTAHERGLDPSPYVRCYENLNVTTRADAVALTERLKLMSYSDKELSIAETSSPSAPSSSAVDALDVRDLAILKFLNQTPSIRRLISEIIPKDGPQNRGAITNRLKRLSKRTPPLVDYPKMQAEGVAILPAGIAILKRAQAEATAQHTKTAHS